MKIAQVVCTYPPYRGGIGNVAYDFTLALNKDGHEAIVFTPDYQKLNYNNESEVLRLKPFLKFGNAAFVPQLFYYLLKGNFDIVHLHYPFFGGMESVWLAKKMFKNKFKLVIHYHMKVEGLPWYLEILRLPSRLINKSLFNLAEVITCASVDYIENNDFDEIYKNNKNKFIEIPFGVEVDKFVPDKTKMKQILYVGGMDKAHYFKGVKVLLKAFALLENQEYSLVLVGNGDLIPDFRKQSIELKINNQVKFAENVDNDVLVKYYQESAVLVLPSINACEAFGVVLLEAMSCGTPVIASALPGVRTVFADKVQGYYVIPGDANDLQVKLKLILENEDLRKQMGEKARELALARYDSEKLGDKLIKIYQSIL